MSMAIQRSKYTGDPGLFSFLGKVVKTGLGVASVIPGIGSIASVARNLIFPGDARVNIPGATTLPRVDIPGVIPQFPVAAPGSVDLFRPTDIGARRGITIKPRGEGPCRPGQIPVLGQCVDFLGTGEPGFGITPQNGNGMMNGPTDLEMRAGKASGWPGYHWNKSDYFLRSGEFVPAGTRAVRNRRRNPANPRATSNAITRIKGAKRYAKSLSSISIRKKC